MLFVKFKYRWFYSEYDLNNSDWVIRFAWLSSTGYESWTLGSVALRTYLELPISRDILKASALTPVPSLNSFILYVFVTFLESSGPDLLLVIVFFGYAEWSPPFLGLSRVFSVLVNTSLLSSVKLGLSHSSNFNISLIISIMCWLYLCLSFFNPASTKVSPSLA